MDKPLPARKMAVGDFLQLYKKEAPFEIIDGMMIPLMLDVAGQGFVRSHLLGMLLKFDEKMVEQVGSKLPYLLLDEQGFITGARVPDMMVIRAERLKKYKAETPDWENKPALFIPDLAIEVISHTDTYSEIMRKIGIYFADGVKVAWIVDFWSRTVAIYKANNVLCLTENDTLRGEDIIPGFEVRIASLFEGME